MGMVHSEVSSTAPCTANRQELTAGGKWGILPQQILLFCPSGSGAVQVQRRALSAKEGGGEGLLHPSSNTGVSGKEDLSENNCSLHKTSRRQGSFVIQQDKNMSFSFVSKFINISSRLPHKQMFKHTEKPKCQAPWNLCLKKTAFWNHFWFWVSQTNTVHQC